MNVPGRRTRDRFRALPLALALLLPAGCDSGSPGRPSLVDAGAATDAPPLDVSPEDGAPDPTADAAPGVDGETDAGTDGGATDAPTSPGPWSGAAGSLHVCAWRDDAVFCWGQNHAGELGTGDQSDWQGPGRVPGLTGVRHVVAGDHHTCAADRDGLVWCWGANDSGQLGDGTNDGHLAPTQVPGLGGVTMLAAGRGHTCALAASGVVHCWGDDCCGQTGPLGDMTRPQAVLNLNDAVEIAAGYVHSCARHADGRISCWGPNSYGELGDGNDLLSTYPADVVGLTAPAVQLVSGTFHVCARLADGATMCWGQGEHGALGDGNESNSNVPRAITMPPGEVAAQLAPAGASCARLASGRVACWGGNANGELGDGTTQASRLVPGLAPGLEDAVGVAGLCAVRAAGPVVCWGPNAYGQIGDGTRTTRNTPTPVLGLP